MMVRHQFPGLALGFAVVLSGLAAHAQPAPDLSVDVWSDEHREIAAESGARITGKWKTAICPYARRPMICAGVDHPSSSVWLRWSAKTSKTQVFLNAAMHCIDTAPRSIMVVCATDQKQKDFEREIWSPNVRATTKVGLKILPVRSRSGEGSTTYHKRFRGGFAKIVNGGSEPQLQQSDIGLLIFEEPSSYPADVGGRGSTTSQARTRTLAWGDDAKELGGGTPKFVGDCEVTDQVLAGTCERFYVPCPHCGARQVLLWENMDRSPSGRPFFLCQAEGCGLVIGHEHKLEMLEKAGAETLPLATGEPNYGYFPCFESADPDNPAPPPVFPAEDAARWAARPTEGRPPTFDGIWQAYSPFTTWARVFKEFDDASASGDPEKMVTFVQQVVGQPFEATHERPNTSLLFEQREAAARIAQITPRRIPPWAYALFLVADVQGDRIEWSVRVAGPAGRRARIDGGIIPINPVDPRAWNELSLIAARTYEGPNCKPLAFDRIGVDTGGHHTSQAYLWCSGRPNTLALKGKPNDRDAPPISLGSTGIARIQGRVLARTPIHLVGTHKLKKDVYFGIKQTLAGVEAGEHLPGSLTFEATATETDFKQLTAEVLLAPDPAKKRKEETWERSPKGAPNEQLDLSVYAMALEASFVRTEQEWENLIKRRHREPIDEAALPLETLWDARAEAVEAPSDDDAAASAARASTAPPKPKVTPANVGVDPDHPLLKLARRQSGLEEEDDA